MGWKNILIKISSKFLRIRLIIMDCSNGDNIDERLLFGGALSCILPRNLDDISQFREVPDHQEVFAHKTTDQSLIVDILQYQSAVGGEAAARFHFTELAATNESSSMEVNLIESIPREQLSFSECSEAWVLSGWQDVSKFNEDAARNRVNIHMGLYRLPQFTTDIL